MVSRSGRSLLTRRPRKRTCSRQHAQGNAEASQVRWIAPTVRGPGKVSAGNAGAGWVYGNLSRLALACWFFLWRNPAAGVQQSPEAGDRTPMTWRTFAARGCRISGSRTGHGTKDTSRLAITSRPARRGRRGLGLPTGAPPYRAARGERNPGRFRPAELLCPPRGQRSLLLVGEDQPGEHHVVAVVQVGLRQEADVVVNDPLVRLPWHDRPVDRSVAAAGYGSSWRSAFARLDLPPGGA
jgi:hypothetical protein